jgi:glycosyltransferase involved in cell wall biosynthesis
MKVGPCLDSVLAFDVPPGVAMEVWVVDGISDDDMRAIVAA